jgi:hypothetical protein
VLAYAVFAALSGGFSFWDTDLPRIFPSSGYALIPVAPLLLAVGFWQLRMKQQFPRLTVEGSAFGLLMVGLSDWICRSLNLLQGPTVRGEILLGAGLTLLLVRYRAWWVVRIFPLLSALLLWGSFMWASAGEPLFSDDHATFFYRLFLLRENFPSIPFYLPLWNSGLDARDFFATGSLNLFFLAQPWIYLFPLESLYNYLVAGVLFLIVPGATYLAGRILAISPLACSLAATIALGSSLTWYRWTLKYGTMGFSVSAALVPLVLALTIRFLSTDRPWRSRDSIILILAVTLVLLWSLSGVLLFPLVLLGFLSVRIVLSSRQRLLAVAAIVALNLPWMVMFWNVSKVTTFLSAQSEPGVTREFGLSASASGKEEPSLKDAEKEAALEQTTPVEAGSKKPKKFRHKAGSIDLRKALLGARDKAVNTNPLVLFLALPGLFLLPRFARLPFGALLGWLLLIGTVVVPLKPQLELDRALVLAALIAALPAGVAIATLLQSSGGWLKTLTQCLVGGFLFATPWSVSGILWNRSLDQYHFREPIVTELTDAINRYGGKGRVVFSGCILHELSFGHLAPLIFGTEKPLVASTHVHNIWTYTQVIPSEFMALGDPGIRQWIDLQNASAVVAHESEWRDYFQARPEEYRERWSRGRFRLYEILNPVESYFVSGAGTITQQTTNAVQFRLAEPAAILKFSYYPFLTVTDDHGTPQCNVSRHQVSESLSFVALENCPINTRLNLHSVSPLTRLFSGGER